jgi:hypothetical protein
MTVLIRNCWLAPHPGGSPGYPARVELNQYRRPVPGVESEKNPVGVFRRGGVKTVSEEER